MFTNQTSSFALLGRSALSSFALAVCLVLSYGLSVNAQNPGSSHDIPGEGSNTLQGRIYLPVSSLTIHSSGARPPPSCGGWSTCHSLAFVDS